MQSIDWYYFYGSFEIGCTLTYSNLHQMFFNSSSTLTYFIRKVTCVGAYLLNLALNVGDSNFEHL